MSTLKGTYKGHKFHGDPLRFEVIADFVFKRFGNNIKFIADVAGGQGMLTRILNKKYNYKTEVVDPRGHTLVGVPNRQEEFNSSFADYYDLVIGLHPDEATNEVAKSARIRLTILVPCCNFWDRTQRLGTKALINELIKYYEKNHVKYENVVFNFKGPKNIGLITKL